ncbi:MAG: hypothetical protein KBH14_08490, partial [Vicinamibacteria bacterium]|nr:hypothetical protein [Vicinamibacteria bacterium]
MGWLNARGRLASRPHPETILPQRGGLSLNEASQGAAHPTKRLVPRRSDETGALSSGAAPLGKFRIAGETEECLGQSSCLARNDATGKIVLADHLAQRAVRA